MNFLEEKVDSFGAQYKTFALFVIINYPVSYFILYYFGAQINESATVRAIALVLCIPLIFTNYWPNNAKKYLNLYWFTTLLYCLPILGTYGLLINQISMEWLMNMVLGIFLLILLVDWVVFIGLLALGIPIGYLLFLTTGQELVLQKTFSEVFFVSHMYIYAIVIGIIFARGNKRTHQEKIHTMKMLAGSIAHELRTPLSAMMMDADALSHYLPYYEEAYSQAKEANLPLSRLHNDELQSLKGIPQNLQVLSRNAHTMINMLLTNLNEGTANRNAERCSMKDCVEEALNTYPFSLNERELVDWNAAADFFFLGHKELTKHIIFNLIKNALYAIASVGKGKIFITIEQAVTAKNKGRLIFKDTGPGIAAQSLPHIFDRFYTKTRHGTGIGLAFCQSVIRGFGGEIECSSQLGDHTTFTISLPIIKKEEQVKMEVAFSKQSQTHS